MRPLPLDATLMKALILSAGGLTWYRPVHGFEKNLIAFGPFKFLNVMKQILSFQPFPSSSSPNTWHPSNGFWSFNLNAGCSPCGLTQPNHWADLTHGWWSKPLDKMDPAIDGGWPKNLLDWSNLTYEQWPLIAYLRREYIHGPKYNA